MATNVLSPMRRGFEHDGTDLPSRARLAGPVVVFLVLAALAVAACGEAGAPATADLVEWGYAGPGAPDKWASLSDEYATCADGQQQSPVDITGYEEGAVETLSFRYGGNATAVRNDGRLVHVDFAPGSTVSIGGQGFDLQSVHLHSPSEHRVDGVGFAAELHMVHADADGRLAVVGQLFGLGEPSAIVQAILDAAPAGGGTAIDGIQLDAAGLVPDGFGYYHYAGSKTTPPCHEPVGWYVMREPRTLSQEQVSGLQTLGGGPTNRPVQPLGSRAVVVGGTPEQAAE